MSSKKKNDDNQIPLSESQNTAITGRKDISDNVEISINGNKVNNKVRDLLLGKDKDDRPYRIKEATIKEDVCHYSYEIISGVGIGDTHSVKGSALFKSDLLDAFAKLRVHLAFIDDSFKLKGIEVGDIDKQHGHDLTFQYNIRGFKIKGTDESESVVLIGYKYVSNGIMELETPKIPLDNLSSYKWYNELKTSVDQCREEVALYKEGKCEPVEVEDDVKPDPKQKKLPFGSKAEKETVLDEDFADAKV